MSAATRDQTERTYHDPPKVTPEREHAWERWIDDYIAGCAAKWVEQGSTRDEILPAAALILVELQSLKGKPWMPLGLALMHRTGAAVGLDGKGPLDGEARTNFLLSLRTAETSTEVERTEAVAHQFGLTVQQAANLRDKALAAAAQERGGRDAEGIGRVSLYRHYDAAGALLYVGIAKEPERRAEQHRLASPWFRFVADTDIEWHATREAAAAAERQAIHGESPLFNTAQNRTDRKAAIDYLFAALESA